MSFAKTMGTYGSLVKISHTVFALPFALAAVILASSQAEITVTKVLLIVVCIAAARTAAMAFNRLIDRDIDGENPRTADRELPTGAIGVNAVRLLVLVSCAVFIVGAGLLGRLPLLLSPLALGLALGYSYTKRFTSFCHVILGAAVALAPGGAWIAVGAPVTAAPWLLVVGVACWVAGFDVLYSLQDEAFDREHRLSSVPVQLGVKGALVASALLHLVTVGCLFAAGLVLGRGIAYKIGVGLIASLLLVEHIIVKPGDLSKLGRAVCEINGYVSVAFLAFVGLDQLLS